MKVKVEVEVEEMVVDVKEVEEVVGEVVVVVEEVD